MRYVLDCSVAVKWFVPEPLSDVALKLLERLRAGDIRFVAPDSIVAELGHSLRKLVFARKMTPEESRTLIADFVGLSVATVPVRPLAVEAMRLTTAHMTTFYDALYMSLELREDLKVLTADDRMVNAFAALGRTIALKDLPA